MLRILLYTARHMLNSRYLPPYNFSDAGLSAFLFYNTILKIKMPTMTLAGM